MRRAALEGRVLQDILVHVDATPGSGARLDSALDLARRFCARVTAVYPVAISAMPAYVAVEMTTEVLEQARDDAWQRAREAERAARAVAVAAAVGLEWRCVEGDPVLVVNDCARSADLVVLSQPQPDGDVQSAPFVDEVVIGAGRPVLLVPSTGAPVGTGEHVLVAWNGSRESTRALHDALPLLARARKVVLLALDERDPDGIDLESIHEHLQHHGIGAEALRAEAGRRPGDRLLSFAAEHGIDLVVMGAWGHSRLREMVLGGVTAHMIANSTVPVLLVH